MAAIKQSVEKSMAHDPKDLLLTLSLECAAAKEALSVVEAFSRYLHARCRPEKLHSADYIASSRQMPTGKIFQRAGKDVFLLLPITIPILFQLSTCASPELASEEIAVLERVAAFFKEKSETILELKGLTYTDDLTGLYNQRYLELVLDRELSLAKRNNTEFSVLFLDLDHFKMVNDTHGHLIGSRLLYEVGQEIKKALRESDITFRYGGDEFVMILSHTGLEAAIFVAERIRVQIEKKRFLARDSMDIRLTASIGVASVPEHAVTKAEILKAADEALYGVKKAVRNKVIAATAKK